MLPCSSIKSNRDDQALRSSRSKLNDGDVGPARCSRKERTSRLGSPVSTLIRLSEFGFPLTGSKSDATSK